MKTNCQEDLNNNLNTLEKYRKSTVVHSFILSFIHSVIRLVIQATGLFISRWTQNIKSL